MAYLNQETALGNACQWLFAWDDVFMRKRWNAKPIPGSNFRGAYSNALNRKWTYRHQRRIKTTGDSIEVTDQWKAATVKSVENLIHLHPQCEVQLAENAVLLKRNGVTLRIVFDGQNIKAELRNWFYVPEFGRVIPANVLVLLPKVPLSEMSYSIQGLQNSFLNNKYI